MIPISKYHGCGNDFIIVRDDDVEVFSGDLPGFAARACSRRTGIGADGLIVLSADPLEMKLFNSDGSEAPMCGNGIRCFAHYCRLEGLVGEDSYIVKTLAGDMAVKVISGSPFTVEIDLGPPQAEGLEGLSGKAAGNGPGEMVSEAELEISGAGIGTPLYIRARSIFLGTLHTVIWVGPDPTPGAEGILSDDGSVLDLEEGSLAVSVARAVSNHRYFPGKTNVNLARVISPQRLELVTYERGAGFTLACGTGAASAVYMGRMEGRLEGEVTVALRRGELKIRIGEDGQTFMSGPSERIMKGYYYAS